MHHFWVDFSILGPKTGINSYPMEKQVMIPVACVVVHNFIRMVQVGDPFIEEYVTDYEPVGGNVDVNADYVFDDGIDGTGLSTGTQQHDSSRGAMNHIRDMIVDLHGINPRESKLSC